MQGEQLWMVFMSVASLLEGKSQDLQLCAKYRQKCATLSPYHWCWKTKEAASLKVKGLLNSCLSITHLALQKWDT